MSHALRLQQEAEQRSNEGQKRHLNSNQIAAKCVNDVTLLENCVKHFIARYLTFVKYDLATI